MNEKELPVKTSNFDMNAARRKMYRRMAACIISAMAETDADYDFIATRLEVNTSKVKSWIDAFIAGTGADKAMNEFSDLLLAMGCEPNFQLHPYRQPVRPEVEKVTEDE